MQLAYGDFFFDVNSTEVTGGVENVLNEGGLPYKVRKFLHARGFLSVNGQEDAALQEAALRTALAIPFLPVSFLQDSGAFTPLSLLPVDPLYGISLTGVRVKGLRFPQGNGPEYVSIRSFDVEFEAEYAYPFKLIPPNLMLLSFTETLSFEGGYPIFRHQLAIEGPNQKQLIYPQDTYRATQSGQAVGFTIAPPNSMIPAPIWPYALKESPKVTRQTPQREGLLYYRGYPVTWHMEFEDVSPLVGLPHLWPD